MREEDDIGSGIFTPIIGNVGYFHNDKAINKKQANQIEVAPDTYQGY